MKYWKDAVEASLDAVGIKATKEQIIQIASDMETSHDFYGMAHGHDCIPNPLERDLDEVKNKLHLEMSKVRCGTCDGKGRIYSSYGTRSGDHQCSDCHGEGRRAL